MKKSLISVIIAILVFLPFGNIPPTQALTISQLNLELVANPGDTIDLLVQLYDESKTGTTVYPAVYNFTEYEDLEGSPKILTDPADLKPDHLWIQWSEDAVNSANSDKDSRALESAFKTKISADSVPEGYGQVELPLKMPSDGTLFNFPYKIIIPQDGEPGTHLISLVFQTKSVENNTTDGPAVFIGSNVASNIFLKVSGTTIDDIDVDFQAGIFGKKGVDVPDEERKESFVPKGFFLKPPVDFLVTVVNQGNTHQKPDGNIKIINDLFGSRIEEIQVNEENRIILPDTDRTFKVESYGQGFMFGKYRAKITMLYGDPIRPITKEISFWIVPLIEILITTCIIILILVIIIIIRKSRKKKLAKIELEKEHKMRQHLIEEIKKHQPPVAPVSTPAATKNSQGRKTEEEVDKNGK